jgi:type VI secretion system ImpM family protein
MWPQHQSPSESSQEVAVFGKLPWAGDFLQVGHPPGREQLLEWLEHGIALGAERGAAWKTNFELNAQKGFVLPCGRGSVVAGVMAPSRDAVGRRFPFVTYVALPEDQILVAPHVMPLMLGSFLHAAGNQILEFQAQESNIGEAIRRIPFPDTKALSAHEEGYAQWASGETLRNAGQAIFGGNWREELAHALYVTWESVLPFAGQESPPTPLTIRFPLGAGLTGAAVFWLQVVRLCAGWKSTIPCAIWSFEPERPSLTVQLGPNAPQTFADIWEVAPANENLCNLLENEPTAAQFLGQSRPDLLQLIQSETTTVDQLLRAIRPF